MDGGRNVRIDIRWGMPECRPGSPLRGGHRYRRPGRHSGHRRRCGRPLLQATRSIPVVFTLVPDPVGAGFVNSLAQPGGNATGFMLFEYGVGGKYLELLKELAPG